MMHETFSQGPKTKDPGLLLSLGLAFELGYLIALPAAMLGFFGAFLDKRLETSPLFVISGFCIAFAISAYAVWKKVRAIIRQQYGETPKHSSALQ